MKKLLIFILGLTLTWSAFGQSGSLDGKAIHLKITDSTLVVKPSGYGTLYYNTQSNKWRVNQNGIDYDLLRTSTIPALPTGHIWIGSASNVATDWAISGDALLSTSGVVTITGLKTKALPSLSTGNLRYNGSAWIFDNTSYVSTETDPVASAINGVLSSNGTSLSALSGTGYLKFSGASYSFSSTIPNADLTNSSLTINGNSVSLGGSTTVTANTTNSLTIGSELISGGPLTFNGSVARTIGIQPASVTNSMLAGSIASSKLIGTDIATVGTITSGTWNGSIIELSYGGTNANLTASNGGIVWSNASQLQILSGTATASKMLLSGSSATPSWSTSTIPSSAGATANKALISDGTNYVLAGVTEPNSTTTGDIPYASSTNVYSNLAANSTGTNKYLQSVSSGVPSWQQIAFSDLSGTSSVWLAASGATLTNINNISSTTPAGLNFTNTWTATANNQSGTTFTNTLNSRSTASDLVSGYNFISTTIGNAATIDNIGFIIDSYPATQGGVATLSGTGSAANQFESKTVAGMTATTYTNVAPASTSGTGTGALFTVIVASATNFTSITMTTAGSGYRIGETITFNGSQFGSGSGSATIGIATVSNAVGSNSSALRIYNRQGDVRSVSKTYLDFQGATTGTSFGSFVLSQSATATTKTWAFKDASGTAWTTDGTTFTLSRDLTLGTQSISQNPGGSTSLGTVSISNTTTSTNFITSSFSPTILSLANATFRTTGSLGGFAVAGIAMGQFRATNTTITSGIINTSTFSGTGTNGTYTSVAGTGGTGTGATFTITVAGGVVTNAVPTTALGRGQNYSNGDVITFTITGGSASVTVTSIDFASTVAAFQDNSSWTDSKSIYTYASLHLNPTYNITSTQAGSIIGLNFNPTLTATGSFNKYGVLISPTGFFNGYGTSSPLSTSDVVGSVGVNITLSTGNLTLDATHATIIITSGTGTYTFPAASGATRRIYRIVNQTGGARTTSAYLDKAGASQTTVGANASLYIQSDGSNWYQIN